MQMPKSTTAVEAGSWGRVLASAGATLLIVATLAGLLAAPWLKLTQSEGQPIGSGTDIALIVWLLVAAMTVLALMRQTATPRRLWWLPSGLQNRVRSVCEVSAFGVGPLRGWTRTNPDAGLVRVTRPGPIEHERQRVEAAPDESDGPDGPDELRDDRPSPRPLRRSRVARVVPSAEPTKENKLRSRLLQPHLVQRGDTWWSLAEQFLADGQLWDDLRDLNLGAEVAPGVVLDLTSVLRPGWRIQIPVPVPPGTNGQTR
jgi:hypothetical protein